MAKIDRAGPLFGQEILPALEANRPPASRRRRTCRPPWNLPATGCRSSRCAATGHRRAACPAAERRRRRRTASSAGNPFRRRFPDWLPASATRCSDSAWKFRACSTLDGLSEPVATAFLRLPGEHAHPGILERSDAGDADGRGRHHFAGRNAQFAMHHDAMVGHQSGRAARCR
jgi:hypothetical protein